MTVPIWIKRAASYMFPLWLLTVVAALLGSLGGFNLDRATAQALITLVVAVGLGIFISNSGVLSFGHMTFFAVGGYTTAVLTLSVAQKSIQLQDLPEFLADIALSPWVALVVGAVLAGLLAVVLAVPLMRLNGLTASLATFALLIITRVVAQNADTFTDGTRGLNVPNLAPPPMWVLLTFAMASIAVAMLFSQSPLGSRLIASREDEPAARSLGIRVWWERAVAWVLSAVVVAIGGGLFAWQFKALSPDTFYLTYTFIAISMLVVGGINTVTGAVVGTVVVSFGVELIRVAESGLTIGSVVIPSRPGLWEFGLALILLSTLVFRPQGLAGHRDKTLRGWLGWGRKRVPEPDSESPVGRSADVGLEAMGSKEDVFLGSTPPDVPSNKPDETE